MNLTTVKKRLDRLEQRIVPPPTGDVFADIQRSTGTSRSCAEYRRPARSPQTAVETSGRPRPTHRAGEMAARRIALPVPPGGGVGRPGAA